MILCMVLLFRTLADYLSLICLLLCILLFNIVTPGGARTNHLEDRPWQECAMGSSQFAAALKEWEYFLLLAETEAVKSLYFQEGVVLTTPVSKDRQRHEEAACRGEKEQAAAPLRRSCPRGCEGAGGRCCVGAVIYRNKTAVPGATTSEICEPGPSSLAVCSR